jgi:hypothetical protein
MMNRCLLLLVGFVVLAIGLGVALSWRRGPHQDALQVRALATRGLAEHLARTFSGHRALVISNPFTRESGLPRKMREMEDAGLRGLKLGLGSKVSLAAVAFPELKPAAKANPRAVFIDPESTTPLSFLVADEAFDKLARQYPDCDLLVSLIGLPANLQRVQCWRDPAGPKFALLLPDLRVIGKSEAVRQAMHSGKLAAFVLARSGAPETRPAADGKFAAEFEKRFVLVTPEHVDQVMLTYPQLFPAN